MTRSPFTHDGIKPTGGVVVNRSSRWIFFSSSINSGVIWHWRTRSAYLSQSCRHVSKRLIHSYFNFLNVYLDIQDMRDAKKHQHLQSREIGILHLGGKKMFFGVGSVVGPEPMFGQRCSYVPALAVGLGPSSFARSSPNRYARWRQQGDTHPRPPRSSRWVPPPHRGSVVPGGEASSPASESAGPWPDFSPILLHFSTASSSLLMPPDMQGSPRLSWRLKRAVPADAKRKLELKLESDVRPAEQIDVHACRRCSWAVLWWNLLWLLRITPHGGNRNYFSIGW